MAAFSSHESFLREVLTNHSPPGLQFCKLSEVCLIECEPGRHKFERQNCWQWAEQAWLYSEPLHGFHERPFIALESQQRGINVCVRAVPGRRTWVQNSLSLSLSLSHLRIVDSTPNPLDEAKIENFCAACVLTLKISRRITSATVEQPKCHRSLRACMVG